MAKTLQLRFVNESGGRTSISLASPKETLTETEVSEAMDEIIAKNVFYTSGGELVSKYSAEIIDRTVEVLYKA